ncbi:MAG: glycosyltransferase family 4 protein [Patescibacteria group bacterium]
MKTFLLLTLDFPPRRGGVARYLYELAAYYHDKIIVVVSPEKESMEGDSAAEFELHRQHLLARFGWPKWVKAFVPLIRYHHKTKVNLVSHILPLGVVALFYKRFTKKPYIIFLHGMDFALARRNGWKQKLTRQVLREAHVVVANSETLAREVLGFVKPRELDVIYPCLSAELIAKARGFHRDTSVAAHTKEKPLELLTVARLVPRKGHAHVLDALALLVSEHRIGSLHYTIVGSGPLISELEAHTKKLKLEEHVTFVQNANDVELIKHYERADLFIMPTEHLGKDIEGFGTVYVEAAAFGLPSIASDLPGVNEAVLDNETGLLVPSASVTDLAEAIERLAGDPALRIKLGEAGKARALSEFTADVQFAKLAELV